MTNGLNRVTLLGHLDRAPELRVTTSGELALHLRVATTERPARGAVELPHTEWHDVVLHGVRAEGLGHVLETGDALLVEGSLQTSNDERARAPRTEVLARGIWFTGRRARPSPET